METTNHGTISIGAPRRTSWRKFIVDQLKPKGKIFTPFNVISLPIIALGVAILVVRFTQGLGSVTNLSQDFPWGVWKGFNVITGVAFAGGAYTLTFMVYILGMKKYHPVARVTVLNGFLAYVFYAGALLLELGRPWKVFNPIIGNSFGVSSVLFLVAWHFLLYMIAVFIEFSPAVAEWLGMRRVRRVLASMTVGAVIVGITLSTLHQSGLGALFMMAKPKIHPLWYSEWIPIVFFVSSIFAGLSMVIFEGTISERAFSRQIGPQAKRQRESIVLGLSRICGVTMFAYGFLKVLEFVHGRDWQYIASGMGAWYLTEVVGFVVIPCVIFLKAHRARNFTWIRIAAIMSLVGVMLNRLNVSIIAYKWDAAVRYIPTWMELVVSVTVVLAEVWVFRWVVNRMPVLTESPAWVHDNDTQLAAGKEEVQWKATGM